MTVLVCLDTASREVRRYDSSLPVGLTHEAGLPDDETNLAGTLEVFRTQPPTNTMAEGYRAYIRGYDMRPGPWRPNQ